MNLSETWAIEKLDLLMIDEVMIEIDNNEGFWRVYIRPEGGGYPLVNGKSDSLAEAIKQAVENWEDR